MSEQRRTTRRTSARLADKEDLSVNGYGDSLEKTQAINSNGPGAKQLQSSTNGANPTAGRVNGKRKLAYDEEDAGFMFTRTRSKRTKAISKQPILPEPIQEETPKLQYTKKSRKRLSGSPPSALSNEEPKKRATRNSTRHDGDGNVIEEPVLAVNRKRPKQGEAAESRSNTRGMGAGEPSEDIVETIGGGTVPTSPPPRDPQKISLPFADTPIIRRNQEMRKGVGEGHRRSSLGMRGRRASSLIDSGKSNALPHAEVENTEFYKHIESNGLSEPRRMRQLLTWCGTRALGEKPPFAEGSGAKLAAREIQQQLLKDFSIKSELSDWFPREDSNPQSQPLRPNPKNAANTIKIQDLERQIAKLQTERQTWESLLRPPNITDNETSLPPLIEDDVPPNPSSIQPSLLSSPTQITILETLQRMHAPNPITDTSNTINEGENSVQHSSEDLQTDTRSRIQSIAQGLEFEIDKFAGNVHALQQYRDVADNLATKVLGLGAKVLEERDRKGGEGEQGDGSGPSGMRNVLRGLSRVLDR